MPVENSLLFASALKKAGVSLEMHIYPEGCHGLSLATEEVSDHTGDCLVPHCQGWTTLVCSIWMIGGIQLLCLGVIGEYIGKIYGEVKRRPRYLIEETLR